MVEQNQRCTAKTNAAAKVLLQEGKRILEPLVRGPLTTV